VLKAFQQYQQSAATILGSPHSTAKAAAQQSSGPADLDDVDWFALDMILLNFLKLSAGLHKKSLIYWDLAATLSVLADPDQEETRRLWRAEEPGYEPYPLLLDPYNPHYNVATDLTLEELKVFVQRARQLYRTAEVRACEATIAILLQRRAVQPVPVTSLNNQPPDLLSKLDSQAHLLQQLITLLAENSTAVPQPAVAAAGKDEQQAPGGAILNEDPETSES